MLFVFASLHVHGQWSKYQKFPDYFDFADTAICSDANDYDFRNINLGNHCEMKIDFVEGDSHYIVCQYQQFHKDIPIYYAYTKVVSYDHWIEKLYGQWYEHLNLDTSGLLPMITIVNAAILASGQDSFLWQHPEADSFLRLETGDSLATYYPDSSLVWVEADSGASLVLCHDVYLESYWPDTLIFHYYVNAKNGSIHLIDSLSLRHENVPGTVEEQHGYAIRNFEVFEKNSTTYQLRDEARNIVIKETHTNNKSLWWSKSHIENTSEAWPHSLGYRNQAATALWAMQQAWECTKTFGREGSDHNKKPIRLFHPNNTAWAPTFSKEYGKSRYDGIIVGFDNSTKKPMCMADVIGHEYYHAIVNRTTKLSGAKGIADGPLAIEEAMADIWGAVCERYALNAADLDWEQGGIGLGSPGKQNFKYGTSVFSGCYWVQPLIYNGADWQDNNICGRNEHRTGGPIRKWFQLLCDGETFNGVTVGKLGADVMSKFIWDVHFTLDKNVDFNSFTQYCIRLAREKWGSCSDNWRQIVFAFYAVRMVDVEMYEMARTCARIDHTNGRGGGHAIRIAGDENWNSYFPMELKVFSCRHTNDSVVNVDWQVPGHWVFEDHGDSIVVNSFSHYGLDSVVATIYFVDTTISISTLIQLYDTNSTQHECQTGFEIQNLVALDAKQEIIKSPMHVIYPNPVKNVLTIENLQGENSILVIDYLGREYIRQNENGSQAFIDASSWPIGVYFIYIYSQLQYHAYRIIKN